MKARFAKGALAPKGRMYYVQSVPRRFDWPEAIRQGIREVGRTMLKTPVSLIGVRGIRKLAGKVEQWPAKLGPERTRFYLGQVIRMQEEIGTGGAGFRFIYAAFLQKAAALTGEDGYQRNATAVTAVGDCWRLFAAAGARHCKGRARETDAFPALGKMLRDCARQEEAIYRNLLEIVG
jgi:hypothetical protein